MVKVRRIVGESMSPTLVPGDIVLLWTFLPRYKIGDIVMVRHNGLEKIKRIHDVDKQNARVYLLGDNPAHSTDSRAFGWLDVRSVVGKVWWPRRPKSRSGAAFTQ